MSKKTKQKMQEERDIARIVIKKARNRDRVNKLKARKNAEAEVEKLTVHLTTFDKPEPSA